MFYDPMIAKLVAYGPDRKSATQTMRDALDAFYIRGLNHNMPFLSALMAHERFAAGRLTTGFIAEEFPDGFHGVNLPAQAHADLVAVAAIVHHRYELRAHGRVPHFHANGSAVDGKWMVKLNDTMHEATVAETAAGFAVIADKKSHELVSDWKLGDVLWRGRIDGRNITIQIDRVGIGYRLTYSGAQAKVLVLAPRAADLDRHMLVKQPPDMSKYLLSPMPGLLVSLAVKEGQEIKAGEELCVVEAMKMMNILKAERDGTVAKIHAKSGDSLAVDQVIVEFG